MLGGRRRLLREEFRSGRLEQASSKAAVLSDLCDRLKYDSDAATEVHKGIYTERIESFLEKKTISGALLRSATLQRGMLAMHLVLHRAEYLSTCVITLEMESCAALWVHASCWCCSGASSHRRHVSLGMHICGV